MFLIAVRLVGSNGIQGVVETYDKVNQEWRPLCDDGWNLRSASVVCRQLNLGPPVSFYSHASTVRAIEYGIERIICEGIESNIAECDYSIDSTHGCHKDETAGVVCSPSKVSIFIQADTYCNASIKEY